QTSPFSNISSEHLHETVGKTRLENAARYGFKRHLESKVRTFPPLLGAVRKLPKSLGIFGAIPHATLRPINLNIPSVRFTWRQTFHLQLHGYLFAVDINLRTQRR